MAVGTDGSGTAARDRAPPLRRLPRRQAQAEAAAAKATAPAVEAATAGATAKAAPTVPAAEADVAAHLKQFEATLSTSDLANLREKVELIERIDATHVATLNQAGIVTVLDLLQRGATRKGRAVLGGIDRPECQPDPDVDQLC